MEPRAPAGGGSSPSLEALRLAHQRLLRDGSLQFDFTVIKPPPQAHLPEWLRAIGRFVGAVLNFIFPLLTYVFWAGVVIGVALILFLIVRELVGVRFGGRKKVAAARLAPVDWRPEAAKARALLEDADRLAAEGAYDEAVHLILYRSIDDIEGRRPRLVRPALTSRDIAALEAVPGAARQAFSLIAHVVERSFFGGRPVDQGGYAECRRAYEAFAFPEVWA